jgi:GH24 family phage-related lysozyme (muramidase)
MHDSVKAIWVRFNEPLEGLVTCLYADELGLVTTGMGNLVDPVGVALSLPWQMPDGRPARHDQIAQAFTAVKMDPKCRVKGWTYAARLPLNNIRLTRLDVEKLIVSKLEANDVRMRARVPDWESRCADAQLAVHSMAWAMGPNFFAKFPKFTAAFIARDYMTAAAQCKIAKERGTIVERNKRNRQLLENAAAIEADPNAERSKLVWPASEAPTLPPPA